MAKEQSIEMVGVVKEALPGSRFRIELKGGQQVMGHLAGRMRRNYIRILPGDYVKIELSPYDLEKGRITWRFRGKPEEEEVPSPEAEAEVEPDDSDE